MEEPPGGRHIAIANVGCDAGQVATFIARFAVPAVNYLVRPSPSQIRLTNPLTRESLAAERSNGTPVAPRTRSVEA